MTGVTLEPSPTHVDGESPTEPRPADRPSWRWDVLLAATVPTLLFGWYALSTPTTFDHGMNLQVAQNLAQHGAYERFYDAVRDFPTEVQTNGPFVFLSALAIRVFGPGHLGHQFANLAFVAGISVVIWRLLRQWRVLALVGPTLTLVSLPVAFPIAIRKGEIPAMFFLLLALTLLFDALLLDDRRDVQRRLTLGLLAAGAAVTTKTFMLGALPALAVAITALVVLRRIPPRAALIRLPLFLVPQLLFELFRLLQLGSPRRYVDWWSRQGADIAYQSGVDPNNPPDERGLLDKLFDHAHTLADEIGLTTEFLGMSILAVAGVAIGLWLYLRRRPEHRELMLFAAIPATVLATLVVTYAVWWTALLPERKVNQTLLATRRIYPALIGQNLAILLLLGALGTLLVWAWRTRSSDPGMARRRLVGFGAATVLVGGIGLAILVVHPARNVDHLRAVEQQTFDNVDDAADFVRSAPDEARFYGRGWFSAPVISLMADRGFYDLLKVEDYCTLDPATDFLVWDRAARHHVSEEPSGFEGALLFTPVVDNVDLAIYSVAPSRHGCPSAFSPEGP